MACASPQSPSRTHDPANIEPLERRPSSASEVPQTHSRSSSFFLNDSTINNVNGNQHNTTIVHSVENAREMDKLLARLKPVRGAHGVPPCMPGTRNDVFETIDQWIRDTNQPNILWIRGPPGSGKSAIASSLISRFTERGQLCSIFAFKRGDIAISDATSVWRTVAHDLARDKAIAKQLVPVLEEPVFDPGRPDIDIDFRCLIKGPLTRAEFPVRAPVVIIDGMDECAPDGSQSGQRTAFMDTITQWSSLPKDRKLIVTGRDDRIPRTFRNVCKQVALHTGLEVDESANRDIRRFFEGRMAEFSECLDPEMLRRERVLDRLTERAAGLFIWADTVTRFVAGGLHQKQLERVLREKVVTGDNITKLYQQILDLSFPTPDVDTMTAFRQVMGAIIFAKVPINEDDLPHFTSTNPLSVKSILCKLSCVVSVGCDNDFLCDPVRRPSSFYINPETEGQKFMMTCFQLMRHGLRFNICNLKTSHLFNREVEGLSEKLETSVGRPLLYSCRFWSAHLQSTMANRCDHKTLSVELEDFFYNRLLFWLEVMSLANEVAAANASLLTAEQIITDLSPKLSAFARDASRFIVNFYEPISESAPHIYLSALPFSPSESVVARHYKSRFPKIASVVLGVDPKWPACANILHAHTGCVNSVSWSPDGTRLASSSRDKTIRIWDVRTGKGMKTFNGHTATIHSVSFSPDGTHIVSGSSDNTIRIWDVQTSYAVEIPFDHSSGSVHSVAFSPDGSRIVAGSSTCSIRIWDIRSRRAIGNPLQGHTCAVHFVAFSPDGARVISGSWDNTIRIWDAQSGKTIACPFGHHTSSARCFALSPDGLRIASGYRDNSILVWDTQTGKIVAGPFIGHTSCVVSLAFSHCGTQLVSGSWDRTIRIWDARNGLIIAGPFRDHTESVPSVAFSPCGTSVASGSSDETIRIWHAQAHTDPFQHHAIDVNSLSFSPDGTQIISGSGDKRIRVWDSKTGQPIAGPFKGHSDLIESVVFSPDGTRIASGSRDNTIRIWAANTGRTLAGPFKGHTNTVASVAFSPDGERVASGSWDNTIRIWDSQTGQTIAECKGHTNYVNSISFSPNGTRLASGSDDNTIRVWDAQSGRLIAGPFMGHENWVLSVTFSPDGTRIASGSRDETIRIWDAHDQTGHIIGPTLEAHTNDVSSVAFSPDGTRIASGSWDKTIRIWNVQTGRTIRGPFEGHTKSVTSLAFSPNGDQVVSGSLDGTIRTWDTRATESDVPQSTIHASIGGAISLECFRTSISKSQYSITGRGWISSPLASASGGPKLILWVPPPNRNGICSMETVSIFGTRTTPESGSPPLRAWRKLDAML